MSNQDAIKMLLAARAFVTRVELVAGRDGRGNEITYWQSPENNDHPVASMGPWQEWFCGWSEKYVSAEYVNESVFPNVTLARFGDVELTREQWEAMKRPLFLNRKQLEEIRTGLVFVDLAELVIADLNSRKVMVTE